MDIIDRRSNPHGKNLENRQRVLIKARDAVRIAARDALASGRMREIGDRAVSIPSEALSEPMFRIVFTNGLRDLVLPGNKHFSPGDKLARPEGQGGGGKGAGEAGEGGGGEDSFRFVLSREEFLDLFLDDLELPDLVKRDVATTEEVSPSRSGISSDGLPSQLDLGRSVRNSMARRIGLRRPKTEHVAAMAEELATLKAAPPPHDAARIAALEEDLERSRRRIARVPWIDPVDLRYRRFTPTPKPAARAVMFCVMDVSGSMTERMKDLAKQFFLLLHVFLERRYKRVELVFIRHAEVAEEVEEEAFFTDPRTGGTIVSTAIVELLRIQKERYAGSSWNIYVAQASDGDNSSADTPKTAALIENDVLPLVQHYAYIEISGSGAIIRGETDLWRGLAPLAQRSDRLAMRQVGDRRDIFPVFRELFARRAEVR